MRKYYVLLRQTNCWRKKKFNYHVPLKGKIIVDPAMFYTPYIPLNEGFKL